MWSKCPGVISTATPVTAITLYHLVWALSIRYISEQAALLISTYPLSELFTFVMLQTFLPVYSMIAITWSGYLKLLRVLLWISNCTGEFMWAVIAQYTVIWFDNSYTSLFYTAWCLQSSCIWSETLFDQDPEPHQLVRWLVARTLMAHAWDNHTWVGPNQVGLTTLLPSRCKSEGGLV